MQINAVLIASKNAISVVVKIATSALAIKIMIVAAAAIAITATIYFAVIHKEEIKEFLKAKMLYLLDVFVPRAPGPLFGPQERPIDVENVLEAVGRILGVNPLAPVVVPPVVQQPAPQPAEERPVLPPAPAEERPAVLAAPAAPQDDVEEVVLAQAQAVADRDRMVGIALICSGVLCPPIRYVLLAAALMFGKVTFLTSLKNRLISAPRQDSLIEFVRGITSDRVVRIGRRSFGSVGEFPYRVVASLHIENPGARIALEAVGSLILSVANVDKFSLYGIPAVLSAYVITRDLNNNPGTPRSRIVRKFCSNNPMGACAVAISLFGNNLLFNPSLIAGVASTELVLNNGIEFYRSIPGETWTQKSSNPQMWAVGAMGSAYLFSQMFNLLALYGTAAPGTFSLQMKFLNSMLLSSTTTHFVPDTIKTGITETFETLIVPRVGRLEIDYPTAYPIISKSAGMCALLAANYIFPGLTRSCIGAYYGAQMEGTLFAGTREIVDEPAFVALPFKRRALLLLNTSNGRDVVVVSMGAFFAVISGSLIHIFAYCAGGGYYIGRLMGRINYGAQIEGPSEEFDRTLQMVTRIVRGDRGARESFNDGVKQIAVCYMVLNMLSSFFGAPPGATNLIFGAAVPVVIGFKTSKIIREANFLGNLAGSVETMAARTMRIGINGFINMGGVRFLTRTLGIRPPSEVDANVLGVAIHEGPGLFDKFRRLAGSLVRR